MEYSVYWIGIRESEVAEIRGLLAGSITIFGSGRHGNHAFEREFSLRFDYNVDYEPWYHFVASIAREIISNDPRCRFFLYDPADMTAYGSEVASRAICMPPGSLIQLLSNKFQTRQWLLPYVPILPYQMRTGGELCYEAMRAAFPGVESFVVQNSYSCGGSGTWLLNDENGERVLKRLDPSLRYAVSPYQEKSISPNIHLVVYSDEILLLPPSIQLIEVSDRGFLYRGADYPMYELLPARMKAALRENARKIGELLQCAGYRGVCGIDFLISGDSIYFMEVNARFQSSTFLLNKALAQAGMNTSVQELHLKAFGLGNAPMPGEKLRVPYSFYHFSYDKKRRRYLRYLYDVLRYSPETECLDDGLSWEQELEQGTYLYKAIFRGPISAPGPERECRIDVNVAPPPPHVSAASLGRDIELLKLMLLAHGVRLSKAARLGLMSRGGFNHAEFDALDLVLKNKVYVCAPYKSQRSDLSPFCVETAHGRGYFLTYYGTYILPVQVRSEDEIGNRRTDGGILYHDITYLGNDRLRVYHRLGCRFKEQGTACMFCDLPQDDRDISLQDIYQAVDAYRNDRRIRHYLIGGGSDAPEDDFQRVIQIADHIRETTGKPIYLMSLPPARPELLTAFRRSGITQVAFNLELFDRELARRYMPGKGAISLSVYDRAFRRAVELWGRTGDVRTIFIVGLEPSASLLQGVEYVAGLGVAPILSLFRPAGTAQMKRLLPPSDREISEIYRQAKSICTRHGIELGPTCPYCQDNTLKVSL